MRPLHHPRPNLTMPFCALAYIRRMTFKLGLHLTMLAPHTLKQNHLLAALPAADYERLLSRKTAIVDQLS